MCVKKLYINNIAFTRLSSNELKLTKKVENKGTHKIYEIQNYQSRD